MLSGVSCTGLVQDGQGRGGARDCGCRLGTEQGPQLHWLHTADVSRGETQVNWLKLHLLQ